MEHLIVLKSNANERVFIARYDEETHTYIKFAECWETDKAIQLVATANDHERPRELTAEGRQMLDRLEDLANEPTTSIDLRSDILLAVRNLRRAY